jgi:hypothetical protein
MVADEVIANLIFKNLRHAVRLAFYGLKVQPLKYGKPMATHRTIHCRFDCLKILGRLGWQFQF